MQILDIPAGSVLERHGAEEGDVIKSINGRAVTSKSEAFQYVEENKDLYDTWEVVVERLGREETLICDTPQT